MKALHLMDNYLFATFQQFLLESHFNLTVNLHPQPSGRTEEASKSKLFGCEQSVKQRNNRIEKTSGCTQVRSGMSM